MVKTTLILAVVAVPAALFVASPASAKGCIMPDALSSACKKPGSSCTAAKKLPLCTGVHGPGTPNPCMAGSCIGPVGKPPEEWVMMTEDQRKDFVLHMPTAQVKQFTTRIQQSHANH